MMNRDYPLAQTPDPGPRKKYIPEKKTKPNTMFMFSDVHTGGADTDPGVLKAKADKAKADSSLAAYKKKVEMQRAAAIAAARAKKK